MATSTMKFKRGDTARHYFKLPIASYATGGTLFFAAKSIPDNDNTDSLAVIDKSFTDSVVTTNATHAIWTMDFDPADITATFTDGSSSKEYKGEFQYVDGDGNPTSFPSDDDYINVIIYADIKVGTS